METSGPEMTKPIDGLMESAKTRPGTTVSDVGRAQTGDNGDAVIRAERTQGRQFYCGSFEPGARNTCWSSSFPKRFAARRPF
jgi:hypothetical protein